jgi:hypothetical protein
MSPPEGIESLSREELLALVLQLQRRLTELEASPRWTGSPAGGLQCPVEGGSGDLEGVANVQNGVAGVIEFPGNTAPLIRKGFRSAAFLPSGSSSNKACLCPFPNQVSLKLRKCAKDMEN